MVKELLTKGNERMTLFSPQYLPLALLLLLPSSGGENYFKEDFYGGESPATSSSGALIKEALRQVFKIPEREPGTSVVPGRSLRLVCSISLTCDLLLRVGRWRGFESRGGVLDPNQTREALPTPHNQPTYFPSPPNTGRRSLST